MGPVTISKLDWNVSMPLKSASSDQLFEWNHAYRNRKGGAVFAAVLGGRLTKGIADVSHHREQYALRYMALLSTTQIDFE
jgi:hypothetical protein